MKRLFILLMVTWLCNQVSAQLSPVIDSIPMRDGKKLAASIHLPAGPGPWPVILIQTPYDRTRMDSAGLPLGVGININSSNYAFVLVDWRGFHGSISASAPMPDRGEDGYDVVTWITAQSWSNGKVGTWGPSALGRVQYLTAKKHPPGLICCVPQVAGMQQEYEEYFHGGVYRREYVQTLDFLGFGMSILLLAHPTHDIFWNFFESANWYPDSLEVPMLMIGGWYDHNVRVMTEQFEAMRTLSSVAVHDQHKLLMGPWVHGGNGAAYVGSATQGQLSYPGAAGWSDSLAMRFFDYHIRNIPNGWDTEPVVRYFQMGEDVWKSDTIWPPVLSTDWNFYLHPGFLLSELSPVSSSAESMMLYDPHDPSPTIGGPTLRIDLNQGPYDQAPVVESRSDVQVFSTDVLTQNVVLQGIPRVELFVSSDRFDTDIAVRLTDVYPDGRSMLIADGIKRMRFRNTYESQDTMLPGQVYPVTIDFSSTAITFLAGHKIRLDITSSNYPRFDANDNSGDTMYVPGDTFVASNTVHYNTVYPSKLVLPLLNHTVQSDEPQPDAASLRVFPNPASDQVYIELSPAGNEVQLFDMHGKMLMLFETKSGGVFRTSADISALPDGIYLLKAGALTRKVVISGGN